MKRIIDPVHGYLHIPESYFDDFIDTEWFQRLRHVEQSSIRSTYPSARHDRFMHSLGVYELATRIVQSICKRQQKLKLYEDNQFVVNSYLIAALLHDIGHSPFSHTFEYFFDDGKNLDDRLSNTVSSDSFSCDAEHFITNAKPHEKMSAIIAVSEFKEKITNNDADPELVARMIVGCKYHDIASDKGLRNCFIELLHGDLIDADRLDYVNRDVWASGYHTAGIDIERIIDSIVLAEYNGELQVCYLAKALNELESVFAVKQFQQENVIFHHTVAYDQYLLVKAMESAALYHFGEDPNDSDVEKRDLFLRKLCSLEAITDGINLPKHNIPIHHPCDADFLSLMKYIPDNKYVKQWFSRKYDMFPLWKSKAEFFHFFPELSGKMIDKNHPLFTYEDCYNALEPILNADKEIWIRCGSWSKPTDTKAYVLLLVNNKVIPYRKLFPLPKFWDEKSMSHEVYEPTVEFHYVFARIKDKMHHMEMIKYLRELVRQDV